MTVITKTTPLRQVKDVRDLLSNENARNQLSSVAAKHMNPERMMRVVSSAIRTTPKLQEAEPLSMLGALMQCAALGLEPNTNLGHAYLIPFNNKKKGIVEVQLIIGYKGFIDLARRSGNLVSIHADVVYRSEIESGHFSHEYGSNAHLMHKSGGVRSGERAGAYCHIKVRSGDIVGEGHVFMSGEEILAIRDNSQNWRTAVRFNKTAESIWTLHENRMWSKTAVRRLANSGEMPLSIEFSRAMDIDDARVDYAAYAMNPDDGADIIDTTAEDVTEDTDHDEDGVIENIPQEEKKAPAEKGEAKPAPEKKVATDKAAEASAGSEKDRKAAPKENPKGNGDPEARKRLEDLARTIVGDLDDSGMPDAVMDFYKENGSLAMLEAEAPDIFRGVMDEIAAYQQKGEGE